MRRSIMGVIFCIECGTSYSDYGEKCIKCGCPAEVSKTYYSEQKEILLQKKISMYEKVLEFEKQAVEAKKIQELCEIRENEITLKYTKLIDDEEKKFNERKERYKKEKEEKLEELNKKEAEIYKNLSRCTDEMSEKRERIDKCGIFRQKEKEQLVNQLEMLKTQNKSIVNELENCRREIGSLNNASCDSSDEEYIERVQELEEKRKAEYCQLAQELYADSSLVEKVIQFNEYMSCPVSNAAAELYYFEKYNYVIPKKQVEEEVKDIIASLKFVSLEDIIQLSAFLICLEEDDIQKIFLDLQRGYYICHVECELDNSFYYTNISENKRSNILEAEKERKEIADAMRLQQRERINQIYDEIHSLTQEAKMCTERSRNNPSRIAIENQVLQQIVNRTEELHEELQSIQNNTSMPKPKTLDVGRELDLATLRTALELSNVKPKTKDASVVGRAVAGAVVAGPIGAVIGAVSAVDKNLRNKK